MTASSSSFSSKLVHQDPLVGHDSANALLVALRSVRCLDDRRVAEASVVSDL
eukprot:CAMPEP_0115150482 /NCGR_PEP_ID=MMETSP0227-20121206/65070_1 /TAXON_ID=89957 /ORGANISM="Polarella glacialis, Strain CCMP 1383" /LENGTH=51 /DNA_ID=CAMNT_0002560865 /DNA_START=447 /DNA_END=602 /DNA_ORIENTATION=-